MRQLVSEKENSEFKPVKLRLKIDLVSYPARAEVLGKYDNTYGRDPGDLAVRESATEVVTCSAILHFGFYWVRQSVGEARFDQSARHL